MSPQALNPANIEQTAPQQLRLSGFWTAFGLGVIQEQLDKLPAPAAAPATVDAAHIDALDTAGAWILQMLLARLRGNAGTVTLHGLQPKFTRLLEVVTQQSAQAAQAPVKPPAATAGVLGRVGRGVVASGEQGLALLAFVGEMAMAFAGSVVHPARMRWRPILFNIRSAGFDALPIVGLLSFLLGIVVAYQGADQLRQYGANIFVADLVGLSMLREFAPLITAIIIAGRSGSAYAAQIGTMAVTEEIDAMRTLGITPQELLVLPKLVALVIAMPLLTVFADVLGVAGGMLMARAQLDVSFIEFFDRFVKAVSPTAYLIGICKAPVFAAIIATVGCYQGFRTRGGADSVGRQTTRAVVQAIFLVIVADALFSVAFSALDL
jgi:phospholipid/cholesterol/gamma-HCH transport system permease protein